MKTIASVTVALMLVAATTYAWNDGEFNLLKGFLTGYEEVGPPGGAISTTGHGRFFARVNKDDTIDYALKFEELEGTVTQSHIHFGQKSTTGGISVWLCQTATNVSPTAGTPECVPDEWITGTLNADSVIGPAGQGIEAKAFAELVAAIHAGRAYVNVHSTKWPSGEIRSQISHADHK